MAETNSLETLASWQKEVERRLHLLEAMPAIQNMSQKGGTFVLISPTTGKNMQLFGSFGAFYGEVIYDKDNSSMLMVRDDIAGLIKPDIPAPFHLPATQTITAGALGTVFEWEPRSLYHAVLQVRCKVITDGATTGEIRLRETVTGAITNTLTVPINTNKFASFDWLHSVVLGDDLPGSGASSFKIEARRASGAGTFTVDMPIRAQMTSLPLDPAANAAGNAQLI